jgi:crossover junction endodeoxyribonuclease RuvC
MRVLGIDPGIGSTGYAIIDSDGSRHRALLYGAIKTPSRRSFHQRLLKIHNDLSGILSSDKSDVMAIEGVFHAANVQSALKLGHARGIALLVAAQFGLEVYEYSPLEVKSAVVGYGRAEKSQIQTMVRMILNLSEIPAPDDAADALAVALCHAQKQNYELRITNDE